MTLLHQSSPDRHPHVAARSELISVPRAKGDLPSTRFLEQCRSARHSLRRSGCVAFDDKRYVRIATQRRGCLRYHRGLVDWGGSTRQKE
jgi:hypothetical protein